MATTRLQHAVVVGCLIVASGVADAQSTAVLGYRGAEAPVDAVAVAAAVREAVGAGVADGFGRARERIEAGAVPRAWLRDFRRAHELSGEGWRAYLAVHRTFAAGRLSAARRAAERVLGLPGGPALFAETSLRLAVVVRDLGRAEQSRDLFHLVGVLDPERRVTSAEFSPDVVEAFAAAQTPRAGAVRVSLAVRSGGGQVSVDGGPFRSAPADVTLPPGQHVVVARDAGYRPRGQAFEIRPGEAGPLRIVMELEPEPLAAAVVRGPTALSVGTPERSAGLAVEGIVRYAEVDRVALVAAVWRRGKPALLGQLCAGVPARCGAVVEVGFGAPAQLAAAARELWRVLRAGGVGKGFPPTLLVDRRLVQGERGPGHVGGGKKGRAWWRNPYLWIGVGAVALGSGAAVIFSRDTVVEPVVTGNPCDFVSCR